MWFFVCWVFDLCFFIVVVGGGGGVVWVFLFCCLDLWGFDLVLVCVFVVWEVKLFDEGKVCELWVVEILVVGDCL